MTCSVNICHFHNIIQGYHLLFSQPLKNLDIQILTYRWVLLAHNHHNTVRVYNQWVRKNQQDSKTQAGIDLLLCQTPYKNTHPLMYSYLTNPGRRVQFKQHYNVIQKSTGGLFVVVCFQTVTLIEPMGQTLKPPPCICVYLFCHTLY